MLKSFFSNYKNYSIFSIGLLFDFFIKKNIEFIMKHIFIYLSLFFAEKYLIEFLTKKNIEILFFFLNKIHNFYSFSISYFFFFTVLFFFFYLASFNLLYFFFF